MINEWWAKNKNERYWLEITDRDDIGTNLKTPKLNESGKDFWSYSVIKLVKNDDVIFHYDRKVQAITSKSIASGELWEDDIFWAARGTFARNAGIQPYSRPGWYLGLEQFAYLEHPLTLEKIREEQETLATQYLHLKQSTTGALYFPFEMGTRRPLRPMQGYLFKLPVFFVESFPKLGDENSIESTKFVREQSNELGEVYRQADEESAIGQRDPHSVDPALVERALHGHASTQNALAAFLREQGVDPRSPSHDEPNYDLAWEHQEFTWIAEVKSITNSNEEKQLRLGLGQLLRYLHLLKDSSRVQGVLVLERSPKDRTWETLCEELGIVLTWPENWNERIRI